MNARRLAIATILLVAGCEPRRAVADKLPAAPPVARLVRVAGGLDQPVALASPAGDPRLFVVEKTGRTPDEVRLELESQSPQNRFFDADEVASMALFLASDEARGVNGQALAICGGALNS